MTETFAFKEIDEEGLDTLDVISEARNFNRWMYETIRPHCHGKILEIGSGIGNISKFFVEDGAEIVLSDIRDNYCDILRDKYADAKNVKAVEKMDLVDPDFASKYASYLGSFDTVFALNVVEHISDDSLAIANCYKLLRKGGNLSILVPAYQALYNSFDKELEHYRRYNRKSLKAKLSAQFKIIHSQYFNAVGILGWFVTGRIMKKGIIPKNQMSLFDKLLPVVKLCDRVLGNTVGLSVIVVGRKE